MITSESKSILNVFFCEQRRKMISAQFSYLYQLQHGGKTPAPTAVVKTWLQTWDLPVAQPGQHTVSNGAGKRQGQVNKGTRPARIWQIASRTTGYMDWLRTVLRRVGFFKTKCLCFGVELDWYFHTLPKKQKKQKTIYKPIYLVVYMSMP